ncbi:GNAT family N-acetyltransferase [Chryseobacterium sp. C3]|uniref:GNAT family N-acetyltransferase n=1 Tax=Chryseobacterium sp. C3 TaxID=2761532 RepID=UPI001627E65C|nr:GNAT family N-acetyltransferase [Chryseobacterium sp. C3]
MEIYITQQPEFQEAINQHIKLSDFEYKFLEHSLDEIVSGESLIYDSSFISYTSTSWILIIHSKVLHIYGENWTHVQFEEIKKHFDLKKFNNYHVTGNLKLIYDLISFFNVEKYEIIKERIFYKTNYILNEDLDNSIIRNANDTDVNVLSVMLQQYYHEEYEGQNDKTLGEMHNRIIDLIKYNNIFVLTIDNQIVSFCTLINPDVGILFTQINERGKGYGRKIMSYCSNKLLQYNGIVYVMTDKNNVESNALVKNIGYDEYYNYTHIIINQTT